MVHIIVIHILWFIPGMLGAAQHAIREVDVCSCVSVRIHVYLYVHMCACMFVYMRIRPEGLIDLI